MRRTACAGSCALLAVVLTAGCSAGAPASHRATVETCISFGLQAIQRHLTVTAAPPACAGLSPEQVNAAVARAVKEAVGPEPKAIARHLDSQDSGYLARMLHTIQPQTAAPAAAVPTPPSAAAPTRPSSAGAALGLAALVAWFFAAAAGTRLLAGWVAARGPRGRRKGSAGLVPAIILSHFGLAVAGLSLWIAFVITGTPGLAWLGVGLIVLIAGLGMGALSAALPEPGGMPGTQRAGLPVIIIAIHGLLATATILLVLLAAIGAG